MEAYQKCMIEEHSQLIARTKKLHDYVYSDKSNKDDKIEFANKCIQLAAMKKYEECLRARMENSGIVFEEGNYFERVGSISTPIPSVGNDYDIDKKSDESLIVSDNE